MMSGSIIIDHRNVIRLIIMNKQIEMIKKKERKKKKAQTKPFLVNSKFIEYQTPLTSLL